MRLKCAKNIHELDSGVMVLRESRKAEHGLFTLGLQRFIEYFE